MKANAEGVKQALVNEGYTAMVVYNAERNLYRVVIGTFDDRASAENLRDSFKAKHPRMMTSRRHGCCIASINRILFGNS